MRGRTRVGSGSVAERRTAADRPSDALGNVKCRRRVPGSQELNRDA